MFATASLAARIERAECSLIAELGHAAGSRIGRVRYRVQDAAQKGCDIAVVTTQPGSKSTENVMRFGFSVLYVRTFW